MTTKRHCRQCRSLAESREQRREGKSDQACVIRARTRDGEGGKWEKESGKSKGIKAVAISSLESGKTSFLPSFPPSLPPSFTLVAGTP